MSVPDLNSADTERVRAALPGYVIDGQVGRGGCGVVLSGTHRGLHRPVAIKQIPPQFAHDMQVRRRFVDEARLMATIDHPHVVPVYDYIEHQDLCLLVMEYLPGGTVESRFTTEGFAATAAVAIALSCAAGLEAAHRHGILHRDVKPSNLMFSGAGALKLTDFGIAKIVGGDDTLVTRAGEIIGTPSYIAPEQIRGQQLSPATDVYALATMLYQLLSGVLPFPPGEDHLAMLFAHAYGEPVPLRQVAPGVPERIADVVMRGLASDPAERFDTAETFGVALAQPAALCWGTDWLTPVGIPVIGADTIVAAATGGGRSTLAGYPGPQTSAYPGDRPTARPGPSSYPGSGSTSYPGSGPSPYRGSGPSSYPQPGSTFSGSGPSSYGGSEPLAYPGAGPSAYPVAGPPPQFESARTQHAPQPRGGTGPNAQAGDGPFPRDGAGPAALPGGDPNTRSGRDSAAHSGSGPAGYGARDMSGDPVDPYAITVRPGHPGYPGSRGTGPRPVDQFNATPPPRATGQRGDPQPSDIGPQFGTAPPPRASDVRGGTPLPGPGPQFGGASTPRAAHQLGAESPPRADGQFNVTPPPRGATQFGAMPPPRSFDSGGSPGRRDSAASNERIVRPGSVPEADGRQESSMTRQPGDSGPRPSWVGSVPPPSSAPETLVNPRQRPPSRPP
ncbi:serine/threonine-protein kinase, partial [Nocardia uniformis]